MLILRFPFATSCPHSSSKPSSEPALTALGHSLPSAVQPLQPTIVRSITPRFHFSSSANGARPYFTLDLVTLKGAHTGGLNRILTFIFRENDPSWANEIQDDVIEECNKHGGIVHIYVDKNSTQVSPREAHKPRSSAVKVLGVLDTWPEVQPASPSKSPVYTSITQEAAAIGIMTPSWFHSGNITKRLCS